MSKLQQQRMDKIKHIMRGYGIQSRGRTLISVWDLASILNNTWQAPHFVPARFLNNHQHGQAVSDFDVHRLHGPIRHVLRGQSSISLSVGDNGAEFLHCQDSALR